MSIVLIAILSLVYLIALASFVIRTKAKLPRPWWEVPLFVFNTIIYIGMISILV